MVMYKNDIVSAVAKEAGLTEQQSAKAVNAFLNQITEALSRKDSVQLIKFGKFDVSYREAHSGINPSTKEPMNIPAKYAPVFKASSALKDALNK